jgi:ABC-type multidrug transport system fused ATPase/permease subunit
MASRSLGGPRLPRAEGTPRRGAGAGPGPAGKKVINWSNARAEARQLIWQHRGRLSIGLVLVVINTAASLALPWSSKLLINDVIGRQRVELLPWLIAMVAGTTLLSAGTSFVLSQLLGVAAQRAITDMRKRVQQHIERLPIRYFDSTQTGILISRILNDAEGIRNLVGTGLVQLTAGLLRASVVLVIMLNMHLVLTLMIAGLLATFGGVLAFAFSRLRPLFRERGKIQSEVTGRLGESLGGIRFVKAYTAERREALTFARGAHRLFRNIARSMTGVSATMALSSAIVGAVGVIMMWIGGRDLLAGRPGWELGEFVMYGALVAMLAEPLMQLASIGTQITEAFAGLDRIREVMSMPTEDEEDAKKLPLRTLRGDIAFERVSFEYDEGQPVLKEVTFAARAGTTTALVGSSGSGKSTMIGLVMAFHRPKAGRVIVDGHDLNDVRLRDYRGHLGVVLQDNFLFDGTVADNISFSRPDATRAEIEEVARIAHVDEFVQRFDQGYDTIVGERGVKVSGGQRQRIAIARAILADPRILILDEATSSLDSESEALIQDGLRRLRHGRTSFVIAHRLSTIRSADQILVVEGGEIVERGTHEQLMALDGRYRQLHDRQYALETDRYVNPGEDFTPEPERVRIAAGEAVPRM